MLEHRALDRLADFEARWLSDSRPTRRDPSPMGYQPGLDGLRAISVIAVILYHAGFGWMHGGFLGVEVFFVVSGFLITSLLLEEKEASGRVRLPQFWMRRARRLLPALFSVLIVIGVWVALFGSAQQQSDLHRDYLPGIFYFANWGQILGGAQYFGNFSPLRHLWSLAVEEQWYLMWPIAFVLLTRHKRSNSSIGRSVLAVAVGVMVLTWWLAAPTELTSDRVNLLYLSTFTRSSGLLLGAGAAFLWRPWKAKNAASSRAGTVLSIAGLAATALLLYAFRVVHLTDRSMYRWQLASVSILSLVAIGVVVHPAARGARSIFGSRALVALGKRSYGVYLWSWPISVLCGAFDGTWTRFIWAMSVTVVVSEFSYIYIETPIRKGALRRWFDRRHDAEWSTRTIAVGVVATVLIASLAAFFSTVQRFDRAAGGAAVAIDLSKVETAPGVTPTTLGTASPTSAAGAVAATPTSSVPPAVSVAPVQPAGPARLVIVGDSQAHALAINLPSGIESAFTISDGSVDGCSVYDSGKVRSKRAGFNRSFADCGGWEDKWGKAATKARAQIALVVLGAWDVFDVEVDGKLIPFNTPAADQRFVDNLGKGIAAVHAAGAKVALLEVACMRPQDVKGAGVPALPERGDDARVAHLNALLRQVAATDPANTSFVSGPTEWCTDPSIATNLGYRWDGVHVYKPGAKLIYETISPALLAIPRG
ncbi:MAG TPA: acyltransferase family protein [Ilumatobacteraceae bacterium]|nr:acyltransferase family protein [Ilumatobacteraceae bacterium]